MPKPVSERPWIAFSNSTVETVDVPNLPTTIPAATLAKLQILQKNDRLQVRLLRH